MARIVRGEKYLTLSEAANHLDLPRMTLYRWARRGKTANGDTLGVLMDSLTHQYYICERSLDELLARYGRPEERLRAVVVESDTEPRSLGHGIATTI